MHGILITCDISFKAGISTLNKKSIIEKVH